MWPFSDSSSPSTAASADRCPVDEETRLAWLKANPGKAHPFQPDAQASPSSQQQQQQAQAGPSRSKYNDESRLSTEREISSIPRSYSPLANPTAAQAAQPSNTTPASSADGEDSDGKWVYPSAKQFYNAMKRKNQNPQVADMDVVVPIHNAVNEQAWKQILDWESMWTGKQQESSGKSKETEETKLVSFKGRPKDLTWRAWFNGIAGYQHPFDRHDWTVERKGGEQVRYIIDFYTGRAQEPAVPQKEGSGRMADNFGAAGQARAGLSFYLDVRPAPSTLQGLAMRSTRVWRKYFGEPGSAPH